MLEAERNPTEAQGGSNDVQHCRFAKSKARSFVQNERRRGSSNAGRDAWQRQGASTGPTRATECAPRTFAKALFILVGGRIRDQETRIELV